LLLGVLETTIVLNPPLTLCLIEGWFFPCTRTQRFVLMSLLQKSLMRLSFEMRSIKNLLLIDIAIAMDSLCQAGVSR
jgi:hypothetical protein